MLILGFLGLLQLAGSVPAVEASSRPLASRAASSSGVLSLGQSWNDDCPSGQEPETVSYTKCIPGFPFPDGPGCPPEPPNPEDEWLMLNWASVDPAPRPPQDLCIEKFDEGLGYLVAVEVHINCGIFGDICIKNLSEDDKVDNTGWVFSGFFELLDPPWPVQILPIAAGEQGILLTAGDGVNNCLPGDYAGSVHESTFLDYTGDVIYYPPPEDFGLFVGGDDCLELLFAAVGLYQPDGSNPPHMHWDWRAWGKVQVDVTYTYVPNAGPVCDPEPVPDVCEDDTVGVTIDLLQQVCDPDGCIDCDRFQVPAQSEKGGTIVTIGSTGFGNKPVDANGCTTCQRYEVVYIPPAEPPGGECPPFTDRFTFRAYDDFQPAEFVNCEVQIRVLPINVPPIAVDDSTEPDGETLLCTCEGDPITIDVCWNDYDPDDTRCGCPLDDCPQLGPDDIDITDPNVIPDPAGGGKVTFTPPAGFCGPNPYQFTYRIRDNCTGLELCPGEGRKWSNPATVSVNVCAKNEAPIAEPDLTRPDGVTELCTCVGTPTDIDVCWNDHDPDAEPDDDCGCLLPPCDQLVVADIEVVSQPSCGGTAVSIGGGKIRFTPPAGFCGGDNETCTFTYRIRDLCDGSTCEGCCQCQGEPPCAEPLWSEPTTVTVKVHGPPTALDDQYEICEDVATILCLCENDLECAGGPLPCATGAQPEDLEINGQVGIIVQVDCDCGDCQGQVEKLGGGCVMFTPPENHCGTCTFSYKIRDWRGTSCGCEVWSNVATVEVYICPQNDKPDAQNDYAQTPVNTPICIPVLDNDSDPDEENGCGCWELDPYSVTITDWDPTCAQDEPVIQIDSLGNLCIEYTPVLDFEGTCCFTYEVWDICPTSLPSRVSCEDCPYGPLSDTAEVCITVGSCPPPCREPASLLIYPEFNNLDGVVSVLTITNTNRFESIDAKFEYVDRETCQAFDRRELLTENDKLTLITNYHNPQHERGYVYVYAECVDGNDPVVFNHLIGNLMIVDGIEGLAYSVNPFCHKGVGLPGVYASCGLLKTDLDDDGIRDLDELEYDPVADQMLVPRFLGQTEQFQSELILIGMSGGSKFTTIVDLTIYNDNQEAFSAGYEFYCWTRAPLLDISQVFSRNFLVTTTHDPREILGQDGEEAGWFRVNGASAFSTQHTIIDPAVYAVLVESVGEDRFVADLPFEFWCQDNGKLLPSDLHGGEEP